LGRRVQEIRVPPGEERHSFELSDVINEMQGELGTSHAYEIVPDFEVDKPYLVGGLGAEFRLDGKCWRVAKIFVGDPSYEGERSPLLAPA